MSTFTVTNTADGGAGSLRDEIGLANATSGANTIEFDGTVFATPQTITLTGGQLELSNTTGTETIIGPAAGLTVSGGGLSRVFQVDANVTASISGLTITGGTASGVGGGLANNGGDVTLTDCTSPATPPRTAAASTPPSTARPRCIDCTVTGNSPPQRRRRVRRRGTMTLSDCTISGNSAGGTAAASTTSSAGSR